MIATTFPFVFRRRFVVYGLQAFGGLGATIMGVVKGSTRETYLPDTVLRGYIFRQVGRLSPCARRLPPPQGREYCVALQSTPPMVQTFIHKQRKQWVRLQTPDLPDLEHDRTTYGTRKFR